MAQYPSAIYAGTSVAGTTLVSDVDHAANHNGANNEITAIETSMGTNSGTNIHKNFVAGDFAARINSSNVPQQAFSAGTYSGQMVNSGTVSGGVYGTATFTGGTLSKPQVNAAVQNYATATDAGTVTFDLGTANLHTVVLGGNRTLALSNATVGQPFILNLKQDATGTRTVTWFSTILWPNNGTPTLTVTASKTDSFGFISIASGTYLGYVVGQNL